VLTSGPSEKELGGAIERIANCSFEDCASSVFTITIMCIDVIGPVIRLGNSATIERLTV
jgi:hypothetical protein